VRQIADDLRRQQQRHGLRETDVFDEALT